MRKRQVMSTICTLVLLSVMMGGCSGKQPVNVQSAPENGAVSEEETKEKPIQETSKETEAKKNVTLRFSWWGGDTRPEALSLIHI